MATHGMWVKVCSICLAAVVTFIWIQASGTCIWLRVNFLHYQEAQRPTSFSIIIHTVILVCSNISLTAAGPEYKVSLTPLDKIVFILLSNQWHYKDACKIQQYTQIDLNYQSKQVHCHSTLLWDWSHLPHTPSSHSPSGRIPQSKSEWPQIQRHSCPLHQQMSYNW